jgi:dolichol-phosphate mannosyltransferase
MEPTIPSEPVRPSVMTSRPSTPELALIIPVYNEEQCIIQVLEEWTPAIRRENIPTLFIIVDDGSTDHTLERVHDYIKRERRDDILVIHQANQGHGQSCLNGYRKALELNIPRIFQIDSDGQCDPAFFPAIWEARDRACAIYGKRRDRDDGWARIFISWVLSKFLRIAMHTRLRDSNAPFRLYQSKCLEEALTKIPKTFHLANIAIALLLEPLGFVEIPIHFRERKGGQSSVNWLGFAQRAIELHRNLGLLRGSPKSRSGSR